MKLCVNIENARRKQSLPSRECGLKSVMHLLKLHRHCSHSLRGSVVVYVVDGLPEDADDFRYPGDAIEPEIQSELERALSGETVLPEKILDTDWGNIFIAYYPLYNESGEVIGALGIEVAADIEAEAVHDKSIIQRHGKY